MLLNRHAWDPEQWLESQARFWDRCLESNRAFWKTFTAALPAVHWPDPPQVVTPPDEDTTGGEAASPHDRGDDAVELDAAQRAAALRRHLHAARWRHHAASGAAQARLDRLRRR